MINGTYLDWIQRNGNPEAERLMFGVVPAYPIFMFIGIILVIIVSIIKLKLKGIPLREFELAILIVVPLGVIGASIFGKVFLPGLPWYRVFFFWEPGMSLFGSLALGVTVGFVWFYYRSKKTLISVWVYADCIVPNILLGQMFGRIGNFYNHEILGNVVSYESLSWLPAFIKDRLFYFPNLNGFELPSDWWQQIQQGTGSEILSKVALWGDFKGLSLNEVLSWTSDQPLQNADGLLLDPTLYNYGTILYRAPLFLIEGIGNLVLWFLITFVVSNLGRWFSQPKPWDLQPKAYPGWYNKKYKSLVENEIVNVSTQIPIKYKKVIVKVEGQKETHIELKLGFYKAWNKAYYWYVPDQIKVTEFEERQVKREKLLNDNLNKLKSLRRDYKYRIHQIKNKYQDQQKKLLVLKDNKNDYLKKRQEIYQLIGNWSRIFKGNPDGKALEKLNNPYHFFIIRCGVLSGCYILGYLILRIALETQRLITELMIPGAKVVDFIILSLILLSGIIIIIFAQFISPYRYREVD